VMYDGHIGPERSRGHQFHHFWGSQKLKCGRKI
jgi:hypothetical protein